MTSKVAINGLGRIGRSILKLVVNDNEWGYANQMIREALSIRGHPPAAANLDRRLHASRAGGGAP